MTHAEQSRIAVRLEPEGIDSARTPDIEPTSDVEAILRIGNPTELRKRLLDYIGQHSESEVDLVDLAGALQAFAPDSFSGLAIIRQKYESMLRGRKRGQTPFSEYLREYLRQAVRTMAVRAANWRKVEEVKAVEQESARKAERMRQEVNAREQAEAADVEKLVPVIRQEILVEMEGRTPHVNHSPEHQTAIRQIQQKMKKGILHGASSKREHEQATSERDLLLGALMKKKNLFGPETTVYHTDTYDDYCRQADLAVSIENGPMILVDVTHYQEEAGKEFYFNQQNPLRILEYPPDSSLADQRGLPIVVGMTQGDADEAIGQFLKNEAKERLGIKSETADEKVYQESFGRWVEYILLQLEHQQNYILDHSQGITDEDLLEDYNDALKVYEEAIEYFKELKKERYPFVKLNERRPWDRRMLGITSEIRDHEMREGLEGAPPSLPELAQAA